jgi:hypothetical protein
LTCSWRVVSSIARSPYTLRDVPACALHSPGHLAVVAVHSSSGLMHLQTCCEDCLLKVLFLFFMQASTSSVRSRSVLVLQQPRRLSSQREQRRGRSSGRQHSLHPRYACWPIPRVILRGEMFCTCLHCLWDCLMSSQVVD